MTISFNDFLDAILIRASALQDGHREVPLELTEFARELGVPKIWADNAAQALRLYGDVLPDTDPENTQFVINGLGMERAGKVSASGSSPTSTAPIHIHNTVSPTINQSVSTPTPTPDGSSSTKAGWFGAWGTWLSALIALVAILVTLHLAGKI